ncbi:tumor protein p53-inducible nuclear protein 2 [Odontesthes bonariensis]|uniref:tumor protein p53-inducible nuclear protein 2 n=1 Tax=Odontesthes bonariensis TaxID=219752 RepID=UPI003F581408
MFRAITHLLFGGKEEAPEDAKPGQVVEEGWLVVTHQAAASAENQDAQLADTQQSISPLHGDATANMESDSVEDAEPAAPSSSTATTRALTGSFSQPEALTELTQLTCTQKAKALADRHHVSRNAIQRQNRVCQGVQRHSFHLQQPGHRSLGH